MIHKFKASQLDATLCGICKHSEANHVCEACGNTGSVELRYGTMLMCPACCEKEDKLQADSQSPAAIAARLAALPQAVLTTSKEIDTGIKISSDIFNAKTVAILEIKAAIDADTTITNKPDALAKALFERFEHFRALAFELNQQIVDANHEQKTIQVYLNELSNQLTAETREKYRIADITYQPPKVKIAKPASIKVAKPAKLDKAAVRKFAAELGISDFTLTIMCQGGLTPEQAANKLRKSINEAKSETPVAVGPVPVITIPTCTTCGNTLDTCTCETN